MTTQLAEQPKVSAPPHTMHGMQSTAVALKSRRLLETNAAWSLLRSSNAPLILEVLSNSFTRETRQIPTGELADIVDSTIIDLAVHGFAYQQTGAAYCRQWLESGYLTRRISTGRDEVYELTEGALTALQFVHDLEAPANTVTESRLETISERVKALNIETNPDIELRIEALTADRNRIDTQIAKLIRGEHEPVDERRAIDQAQNIISLAAQIPADFARVRNDLEELSRSLMRQLIEEPSSRGTVLDDIFRGVDLLESSDAGRSFQAFKAMLLDPERTHNLNSTLNELLTRDFAQQLSIEDKNTIRQMLPNMRASSQEISQVMTELGRLLNKFVRSNNLNEERTVNKLLGEALTSLSSLAPRTKMLHKMDLELELTSLDTGMVPDFIQYDDADNAEASPIQVNTTDTVDIASIHSMFRHTDIDLNELTSNINATLAKQKAATIGQILAEHPATQGLLSVVGLLLLAQKHATPTGSTPETITWNSNGTARRGHLPAYVFMEPLND